MSILQQSKNQYGYSFDPTYGYTLDTLMTADLPPKAPDDFVEFWQHRYAEAIAWETKPCIKDTGINKNGWAIYDISYMSTDYIKIGGWLLLPNSGKYERGFMIGHGYGGRQEPDTHLPFENSVLFFPCMRGLGRSTRPEISSDPVWHVLHHIERKDEYLIGGCVEDIWTGVTALLRIFPMLAGHLGYLGISFGGGVGALALPWETRIQKAHLNIPTFGNQPLRAILPSEGSAKSIKNHYKRNPHVTLNTLAYYDAATAASYIKQPVHCACALLDPFVAPPTQFAIYRALNSEKQLYVRTAGHHAHPKEESEEKELLLELKQFFTGL